MVIAHHWLNAEAFACRLCTFSAQYPGVLCHVLCRARPPFIPSVARTAGHTDLSICENYFCKMFGKNQSMKIVLKTLAPYGLFGAGSVYIHTSHSMIMDVYSTPYHTLHVLLHSPSSKHAQATMVATQVQLPVLPWSKDISATATYHLKALTSLPHCIIQVFAYLFFGVNPRWLSSLG